MDTMLNTLDAINTRIEQVSGLLCDEDLTLTMYYELQAEYQELMNNRRTLLVYLGN